LIGNLYNKDLTHDKIVIHPQYNNLLVLDKNKDNFNRTDIDVMHYTGDNSMTGPAFLNSSADMLMGGGTLLNTQDNSA